MVPILNSPSSKTHRKMENKRLLFYSLILAITVAITGCKSCNPKHAENPPGIVTYENGVTIPDYEKLPLQIYEMAESAKIDETTAQKNIKQLLGFAGALDEFDLANPVKDNNMLYYKNAKEPSAILYVNLSNGDISLNKGTMAYMGFNSTQSLVKNEQAIKMATGYLQKLGFGAGEEKSMIVGHVGGVNMAIHDDKEGDKIFEKLTTIRFDRKLDDIPVVGHTRLLVQMGEKGVIQSVIKQWAPFSGKALKSESIVNRDEVKRSIEDHLTGENKGAKKIIVNKINLIYYDNGKGIYEPALHIIGVVMMPRSSKDTTLINYKHDMVEPLLKHPRLSYTFKGEDHPSPAQSDAIDKNARMPRGPDEKNK
jgi:hypothetical protein